MRHTRKSKLLTTLLTASLLTTTCLTGFGSNFAGLPEKAEAANYGLSNPTTDSNGVTTWDCVYFGHYWQEDTNGDGVADKNDAKQPIKWRVLSVDSNSAFLLADQNLDCKRYNVNYIAVTWETCTLRSWLNGYDAAKNKNGGDYTSDNFIDNAFSSSEQSSILQNIHLNEDNPVYGTDGGNSTTEQIFLLSISEASNASYGFNQGYHTRSQTREAKNTAYAKGQGACTNSSGSYAGNGGWQLRSPSHFSPRAANVDDDGFGNYYGYGHFDIDNYGVRPALLLSLSSSLWSYAGTVSAEGGTPDAEEGTFGVNRDGCLEAPANVNIVKGKTTYVTGKVYEDDITKQWTLGASVEWTSAKPEVVKVEDAKYITGAGYAYLAAKFTAVSYGETDVTITASDGSKVNCHVKVIRSTDTAREAIEYDDCITVVGELQTVDATNRTVKIEGTTYQLDPFFNISTAQDILANHANKVVAVRVGVGSSNNKIIKMSDVTEIIYPSVIVKPAVENIDYENGKFNKKSFNVILEFSCEVNLPYSLSDLTGVVDKVSGMEVSFSKVSLTSAYLPSGSSQYTGEIPFLLKEGLVGSSKESIEKTLNFTLKPGKYKKLSFTASLKDGFKLEKVNASASFLTKLNDGTEVCSGTVHFANLDMAKAAEQTKVVNSKSASEIKTMKDFLTGTHLTYDESALQEHLTEPEITAINAQVENWAYITTAFDRILKDETEGDVLAGLLDKLGLSKQKLRGKILKKLGIDSTIIPGVYKSSHTLIFQAKDKKTNDDITIKFNIELSTFTLGVFRYAQLADLDYKISNGGKGFGTIAAPNYDAFVNALKAVMESQIHSCFNQTAGKGIDNILSESLVGTTWGKLVNAKYGSPGQMVYTGVKKLSKGYTEEDAVSSVKDVVIILTKDFVSRKTGLKIKCPVDVTVRDYDGNICAEIKDNVVNPAYTDVAAYVEEDEKNLILTDSDYVISYEGNDTGTMTYEVTEYENDEPVRLISYEDVPLTTEKKYVNYLVEGRYQNVSLYNLHEAGQGDVIEPVADIGNPYEIPVSVKGITLDAAEISLEPEQSHILMETIAPEDATNSRVSWSSDNEAVVSVNEAGVLYAVAEGDAVITAQTEDGNFTAVCKVTVKKKGAAETSASPAPESPSATDNPSAPSGSSDPGSTPANPSASSAPVHVADSVTTPAPASANNSGTGTVPGGSGTTPAAVPSGTTANSISGETATAAPTGTQTASPSPAPALAPSASAGAPAPSVSPETTVSQTASPETGPDAMASDDTASDSSTKKSKIKKVGRLKYQILSSGKKGKVAVYRPAKQNAKSITIPKKVKIGGKAYTVTKIYQGAFKGMDSLQKVTVGANVTTIGKRAFKDCASLEFVLLPKKVTSIGKEAFKNCESLRYLVIRSEKIKKVGKDAFQNTLYKMQVKTPKSSWEKYSILFKQFGNLPSEVLFFVDPVKLKYKGKSY